MSVYICLYVSLFMSLFLSLSITICVPLSLFLLPSSLCLSLPLSGLLSLSLSRSPTHSVTHSLTHSPTLSLSLTRTRAHTHDVTLIFYFVDDVDNVPNETSNNYTEKTETDDTVTLKVSAERGNSTQSTTIELNVTEHFPVLSLEPLPTPDSGQTDEEPNPLNMIGVTYNFTDPCASNDCPNRSVCLPAGRSYVCKCNKGAYGGSCQCKQIYFS